MCLGVGVRVCRVFQVCYRFGIRITDVWWLDAASVYLLETRLVLLNRMAQSESGARALLDQSVVPLLCSCKFLDTVERKFCRHEDLQSRPSEEDLFLPTKALCAALRFVNSMLVTLPDHRQLQEEVTYTSYV